ncbi:hypothetical protein [Helicobacter sp. UBA3407]|uniref:hypothetical protein n=1 Tax=Helicobacter TaxID=209 RepID=UPI002602CAC3|nr:hypothetical protein [Helicobacter sp. UBA3407]
MRAENLLLALNDEYKAYSFYASASSYGQVFAHLQNAEQTHINALSWHLQNLGVVIPQNPYNAESFASFSSIEEILQTALINENKNVELYNTLIANEKDSEVLDTFYRLQAASFNNHIPALIHTFEQVQGVARDSTQNLQSTLKALSEGKALLNEAGEMLNKMQNGTLSQMELESFLHKLNYYLIGGVIIGALGASLLNEFLNQNKE